MDINYIILLAANLGSGRTYSLRLVQAAAPSLAPVLPPPHPKTVTCFAKPLDAAPYIIYTSIATLKPKNNQAGSLTNSPLFQKYRRQYDRHPYSGIA
jgi:non-ribosomal peptide synthetase component F